MQHGGQKSEAGGCKGDCHRCELRAGRLERQIVRTDGADRPILDQDLIRRLNPVLVEAPRNRKSKCCSCARELQLPQVAAGPGKPIEWQHERR
jgi:hypothetical protein